MFWSIFVRLLPVVTLTQHPSGNLDLLLCWSVYPCVETENGLFSQCLDKFLSGGIARSYLESAMNGKMDVKLNDGQCRVEAGTAFYYFNISRGGSDCGTERRVCNMSEKTMNYFNLKLCNCLLCCWTAVGCLIHFKKKKKKRSRECIYITLCNYKWESVYLKV